MYLKYLHKKNNPYGIIIIDVFLIMTLIALLVAFQHYYNGNAKFQAKFPLEVHICFNLFYWNWWVFIFPLLYKISENINSGRKIISHWALVYFLIPLIIIIIHQAVSSIIINAFISPAILFDLIASRILRYSWVWVDLIIYFAIIIAPFILGYQQENKDSDLRLSRLKIQYSESHLNALKSQLRPHFLFNTLNALSTLILKKDNEEAIRMLTLLSNFLQMTIDENKTETTLAEEMNFIRHYLEIEKVRFKDKLIVKEKIDADTLQLKIPGFLLQPLVENSIYHAIAQRTSDGQIVISSNYENEKLHITIEDNGPGDRKMTINKTKKGIGLTITKNRLEQMYGDKAELLVLPVAGGGMRVELFIPLI